MQQLQNALSSQTAQVYLHVNTITHPSSVRKHQLHAFSEVTVLKAFLRINAPGATIFVSIPNACTNAFESNRCNQNQVMLLLGLSMSWQAQL